MSASTLILINLLSVGKKCRAALQRQNSLRPQEQKASEFVDPGDRHKLAESNAIERRICFYTENSKLRRPDFFI
jgi:hypothetical protein